MNVFCFCVGLLVQGVLCSREFQLSSRVRWLPVWLSLPFALWGAAGPLGFGPNTYLLTDPSDFLAFPDWFLFYYTALPFWVGCMLVWGIRGLVHLYKKHTDR
ncbi:MAG: hypothetical protein ACOX7F_00230 [Eubacteriales bacterium]|jgi:hypothetical protein